MRSITISRFSFFIHEDSKLLVVRVVGQMDGSDFVDRLFTEYDRLGNPWAFNRIMDFRRYEGVLSREHLEDMNNRWKILLPANAPFTKVAIVRLEVSDYDRKPAFSPKMPSRVICQFMDFHEAVSWVMSLETPLPLQVEGNWQVTNPSTGGRFTISDAEVFFD